jgi:glucose-6-phosphate isomerase
MMNEQHYGYVINTYWDQLNMLSKMKDKNPQRFNEFHYSQGHIYDMIDKLQHQQNLQD